MPYSRSNPFSKQFRKQAYQTSIGRTNDTLRRIRSRGTSGHVIPLTSRDRALVDYLELMNHPWSGKLVSMPYGLSQPCRLIKVSFEFEVRPYIISVGTNQAGNTILNYGGKTCAVVMFGKPYDDSSKPVSILNPTSLFGQKQYVGGNLVVQNDAARSAVTARTHGIINLNDGVYGVIQNGNVSQSSTTVGVNGRGPRGNLMGVGSPNLAYTAFNPVTTGNTPATEFDAWKSFLGITTAAQLQPIAISQEEPLGLYPPTAQGKMGPVNNQYSEGVPFAQQAVTPFGGAAGVLTGLLAGHTGGFLPAAAYCTTMSNPFSGSLPTPSSFGGPGTSIRSIAQGVQLYCTSPADKRKGSCFMIELPGHQSVADTSLVMLKSQQQDTVRRYPLAGVTGLHMTWHPQAPFDFVMNARGVPPGYPQSLDITAGVASINPINPAPAVLQGDVTFNHGLSINVGQPEHQVPVNSSLADANDLNNSGISHNGNTLVNSSVGPIYTTRTSDVTAAINSSTLTLPSGTALPLAVPVSAFTNGKENGSLFNFMGEGPVGCYTNLAFFEDIDESEIIIGTYTHVYEVNDPYSEESTFPVDAPALSAACSAALMSYSSGRTSYLGMYGDKGHTSKLALASVV